MRWPLCVFSSIVTLLAALSGGSVGCAQPSPWRAGSAVCLASPSAGGSIDPATHCPTAIDTAGPAFSAADALLRPAGPHRYQLDPITTTTERGRVAGACCYQLQYPPPPG